MKARLLQLLNIRRDEAWLVTNLFWLQFFQGAGVAVFNIITFAMFLKKFDVIELPKVYAFSAVLLLVAGWLYSKFEHKVSIKTLIPAVIVFVAASMMFFRVQFFFTESPRLIFLLFSWYYVVYLFCNLEFWGTASLLFDIRQSKRLFGMIGAGDISAKLIGYSAVGALARFYSNENLLILAFGLILCSLFFYFRLRRKEKLNITIKHEHRDHEIRATQSVAEVAKGFFGNRMIALLATLSFIVVTCVTVISFSFLSEIKREELSDVQLASFIGLFYTAGKVIAIVMRLLLTGRISNLLGTKGTLLISPLILMIFLVIIIVLNFAGDSRPAVLYIFGLMAIITEMLKTSLQDPIFLSLMQPLSTNLRLKGHTVVKGVMDPFALAFSGFMLFSLIQISQRVDLVLLSFMLITLIIVWVVMIFFVDREYVRTLLTALNKRYSVGQEIDLTEEKTKNVLLEKISSGDRGEAIYILNLAEKSYSEDKEELVARALKHPQHEVRMEAIRMAERKRITAALPQINEIIEQRNDLQLLPEAVKAKCMLEPDELENIEEFLDINDHRLIKYAILGFMTSGGINGVVVAGQKLLQLISSPQWDERKIAAEIIGELGVQSFYKPLLELMKDENEEVVRAAIIAAGKVKNEKLILPLIEFFTSSRHEKQAAHSIQQSGEVALKEIKHALTHPKLSRQKLSKLILICGKTGNEKAISILDELVWKMPSFRYDIFHALHLCEFKSQPHHRHQHLTLMHQYIESATRILFMIHHLKKIPTAKILSDALQLELNEIRDLLFLLFSFVFDREKMIKARNAFQVQRKESMANALEIIEIEVPKDISLKFIRLFEPGTLDEKYNSIQTYYKEKFGYEDIIDEILHNQKHYFHRWTKAAALHSLIFYQGKEKQKWLEWAQNENDFLIQQTSSRILAEMN